MTDVIDDSLSWEQRRELRRKKRQELLAEADRLVNTDRPAARTNDDDDSFEQERQKRRREREEKRKKEREDLERQLKEEEEARVERERRREERRRQREGGESIAIKHTTPKESYSFTTTSITSTTRMHHDSGGEEDVIEKTEVTEVTEMISNDQDDFSNQNGEEEEDVAAIQNGHEEEMEEEIVEQNEEEAEDEDGSKTYKSSFTSVTITTKSRDVHVSSSASSSDGEEEKEEVKQESVDSQSSSDNEEVSKPEVNEPAPKSRAELLEERRRQRELRLQEEEEKKKAEEEMRKAEYDAKLKADKEERERRMAEGEAKRKEFRKQSSQEPLPLSPKGNAATPLVMKSGQNTAPPEDDLLARKNDTSKPPLKSKPGHLKKAMEAVGKHSYPSRSQSVHVRSSTTPGTPSRPITRKNQTRRSLNAMEKQAGDLYNFLSELEDVKSAGTKQLKEFLDNSERSDKYPDSMSQQTKKPVTSVRDRLKQFSSGAEVKENTVKITVKDGAPELRAGDRSSKMPRPPTRSDSMKRLELARSKHALGTRAMHRPLSAKAEVSAVSTSDAIMELTSEVGLCELKEEEITYNCPDNASEIKINVKTSSSVSRSNGHISPESENEGACVPEPSSEHAKAESQTVQRHTPTQELGMAKVDETVEAEGNYIQSCEDRKSDKARESEQFKPSSHTKQQNEKESTEALVEAGSVKTRSRRGHKPDLPPKPPGIDSPSGSPSRSPRRNEERKSSQMKVKQDTEDKITSTLGSIKGAEDVEASYGDDLRAKRRARRRNERKIKDEMKTSTTVSMENASVGGIST